MQFQVEFYETEDGKRPTQEFLDSLEPKMNAKMVGLMEILEEKGYSLREPYSKPLGEGIFELRAIQGSNISRALYFFFRRTTDHYHTWIYQKDSEDTEGANRSCETIS